MLFGSRKNLFYFNFGNVLTLHLILPINKLLKSNEKHNFMRSKTETQDTLFLTRHESGIYLIVYHEYHGLLIY